ncbi:MAG: valine--tRNA ligase [Nanoarchaeota archaeon]
MALPKFKDIKAWNIEIEKQITQEWKESEQFNFDPKKARKIYSIDTPPPYVNTPIHMGHAVTYCYMDFFARYKRMKGFEVLFPLGLDRNGLPIEMAAEKKFNISAFKEGREKFIEYCEKLLAQTSEESTDSFARLGISFTSYKKGDKIGSVYLTDSHEYRSVTQSTFIDLYKKGLVYEDNRINNWDPKLRTTIADAEIDYKDIPSTFNDVKWKVKETGEEIVIGTTRPELICACGKVIFNPKDSRYKHLEGKTAISPLFNEEISITAHPLAQIDKGTGLVMMCSAGDISDIQFFRELKLKNKISINQDGTMNERAKFLQGLKVKEARTKIIELLKEKNLLKNQTQITHRTPISERSGAEIEFIEMKEFYLKQLEFKSDIKKIVKKINFYPSESKKILDDWIESVSIDWPISRRRYYATPIPLWHSEDLVAIPPAGKYYSPWKESPPQNSEVYKKGKKVGLVKDKEFSKLDWKGEERVFDTWFDSSISELVMLRYTKDKEFFNKAYPASLRPQGKEIVRTWLYYTILRGYLETGKPCFEDAWIHQHILDEKGRKMSKSLGNVVDPQELLRDYGAEALRLWSAEEGDISKQDLSCSKERIKSETKTINKIINAVRFILQFEKPKSKPKKIKKLDQMILNYIEYLTALSDKQYNQYDFWTPALKLRHFLWEVFASHYLEMVKARAYNAEKKFSNEESESARYSLYFLMERYLTLMYPIIPQLTTTIATELGINLLKIEFPKSTQNEFKEQEKLNSFMEFNSQVWKAKREKLISLKESISGIDIPKELKDFESDLIASHNLL